MKLPHATHITGIVEVYKTTKEIFLYVQKFLFFSDIRHVIQIFYDIKNRSSFTQLGTDAVFQALLKSKCLKLSRFVKIKIY